LNEGNPTPQTLASLPTAQTPRFAGKVVFVIRRQQADMPTIVSANNKSNVLFIFLEEKNLHAYFASGEMPERSNVAVLKTVDCYRSGGLNPSLRFFL
jgi:hypothetical protein